MLWKDDNGFTLVLSFIIISVLVILSVTITSLVISEFKASEKYYQEKQAYYYARSGADYAIGNTDLYKNLNNNEVYAFKIDNFENSDLQHIELNNINNKDQLPTESATAVMVKKNSGQFKIQSLGNYQGENSRLSVIIELDTASLPPFDYAVFATGNHDDLIEMNGSCTINGDMGTNATSFDYINFTGTAGVNGDFWIHKENIEPPDEYNEEPREPEWSSSNTPYYGGDKVFYEGLHYEAKYWTTAKPDESNAWNLIIPEDEVWKWFDSHTYMKGEQVWYDGQIYTAKWNSINNPPPGNGWELQVPNVTGEIIYFDNEKTFPSPEIPDFPNPPNKSDITIKGNDTGEISDDGSYNKITVKSNTNLIIDREGGDRIIRVKDFNIVNGHIKFKDPAADGTLKIYIEEEFTFGAASSINKPLFGEDEKPENVEIYYKGDSKPDFGGNIILNGNLFIQKSDFDFGGSNSTFGYIFSNGDNINVFGAANVSGVYAPNSHVSIHQGGALEGFIISESFLASGGVEISYIKPDLDKMPDDFISSVGDSGQGQGGKLNIIKWSRN